ncbi:twin-arginine translocation pathway signal protein [Nitrospirillum iridis]|uniref:Lipid-binding SYLF domain-containing protein n=1 Tax=Nitrospirillum iridis TaxID=765888 RepID=A0A7X0AYN3_9PROT|nr:twin-arginine translocation pathway signal protein [Nitrospirillum iridis]MBB6251106.1 lipid-binding SYLF domain-containing protein [Nitrospirillum iridis]
MALIAKQLFLAVSLATFTPMDRASLLDLPAVNDLNNDADQALHRLYKTNALAETLSRKARSVLIFPNVVKAGLVLGSAYGEGVLKRGSRVEGYYNCVAAPLGLPADHLWPGAQPYGYVVFLMTPKAEIYAQDSMGWEIGVGPTVVLVDEGTAAKLSSSSLPDDAYAFIFDQDGLMAGINIDGTRIARMRR